MLTCLTSLWHHKGRCLTDSQFLQRFSLSAGPRPPSPKWSLLWNFAKALSVRDCAMITRSGAGPKQGGGYPTFYWAWGGVIWFLFWFEGGSDNFILLYFTSFNAFFVCLPCVKKPYIIHRFILSPYGPTIYYNGMFLFCAHFTRHGTNWWWTCLWPDVTPFHRGGSARGIACRSLA